MTAADRSSEELWVCHLGTVAYRDALAMQDGIRARRQAGELPDTLLLLEHPPVYTGVWVRDRKIASIGLHVSRGISTHGFAVNVEVDLEPFSWVVACGLPDVSMTSLALETGGRDESPRCFRRRAAHN